MSKWMAGALIALVGFGTVLDADAQRRFGGAKNLGRQSPAVQQRQATPPPAQQNAPQAAPAQSGAQQSAAARAPGAAGAAAAARSPWRGALMGLAAGLGIAALASWLGFGEALTMFLTVLLVGMAVMLLLGFVMRRMRGPQPAPAGMQRGPGTYANVGYETTPAPRPAPVQRTAVSDGGAVRRGSAMDEFMRQGASAMPAAAPLAIPAGFDTAGFLAQAKQNFIRLQHAWDAHDLDEIAEFTTNDMFIALTHELRTRAGASHTEVAALDAELLGIESGSDAHVASVKFEGTLRIDGTLEQVAEVWNLEKPVTGKGGWLLAGIQQLA